VQLAQLSCWAPVKSLAVNCVLADAGVAIADLKLDDVASSVIGQFETETNCGQLRLHKLHRRFPLSSASVVTLTLQSRETSSSASSSPLPPVPPTSSSLIGSAVDVVPVRERARASNVKVLPSTLILCQLLHLLPQPPTKFYTLGHQAFQSVWSQRLLL